MTDFQTLQDSVVIILTRMESQISRLKRSMSETEDEDQEEEKDEEAVTEQSGGPPPDPVQSSTSYFMPPIVEDSMSSLAFNIPLSLSHIAEKSPLPSPSSVSDEKGKVRIEPPPIISSTTNLPSPSAVISGATVEASTGTPFGIDQLQLEGLARYASS